MTNIESKMNWQVKEYQSKNIRYEVHDTGENFGTVCVPTGGGKSGMMIRDMIWHIDHTKRGERIVLNMSAPMLNLCSQLAEDIFSVVKDTHIAQCKQHEFAIFINSSADEKYYKTESANIVGEVYEVGNNFENFYKVMESNPNIHVAFVISCHASLKYFAKQVKQLKKSYTLINYLDESHVLINFTQRRDYHEFGSENEDEIENAKLTLKENARKSAMELLLDSNSVYCFSATPDKYVTRFINKRKQSNPEKQTGKYHIHEISPLKLIHEGIIVSPEVHLGKIQNNINVNAQIAMEFMEFCKNDNPNIPHKVLISCEDSRHIADLEDELNKNHCTVFSTCANNGARSNYNGEDQDERGNFIDISSSDFIKQVDECKEDCYVLHIRQLRAGIDIKTLTDCIITNKAQRVNDGVKVIYIQTIGRILRPYADERNRTDDGRLKKKGNVLFLIGSSDYDNIASQTTKFAIKYYGLDGVKAFSKDVDGKKTLVGLSHEENEARRQWERETMFEIQQMRENVFEFINENVRRTASTMKRLGGKYTFDQALLALRNQFGYADCYEPVGDLFRDYTLMSEVSNLLRDYGINE